MLRANNILAILLGLNGLCHGRPSTVQDLAVRSRIDYSDIYIHDVNILDAFDAAGRGPLQEWMDGNNDTYQSLYLMDEAEWDAMHHHCLEKAYTQRLEEALGHFPKEHHDQLRKEKHESLLEAIHYVPKSLVARVNVDDVKTWVCSTTGPLAYKLPIAAGIGIACGGFVYTVGALGKKQIVKLTKLDDGETLKDRYGNAIVETVTWTWRGSEWAGAAVCAAALDYGVKSLCNVIISGNQGSGDGSQGISKEQYTDSSGKVQASGSVSLASA